MWTYQQSETGFADMLVTTGHHPFVTAILCVDPAGQRSSAG
jgi:hypothetical protein